MAKTPATKLKKPVRRMSARKTEHALASRVAAHLDTTMYTAPKLAAKAIAEETQKVADVATRAVKTVAAEAKTASAPVTDWFGDGIARITSAVETAQALAQESVKSFAESRVETTNRAVVLQQKVIAMAQSNVADSLALVQKLMTTRDVAQALAVHNDYARATIRILSDQAKELQALSARFAEDAHKPLAAHWSRTAEVLRGKLH